MFLFHYLVCWNDIENADRELPVWFPHKRSWQCIRTGCTLIPSPANFAQIVSFCLVRQLESVRVACDNKFSGVYLCPDFWQRFCVTPAPVHDFLKVCAGCQKFADGWGQTDWEGIRNVCSHISISLENLKNFNCARWTPKPSTSLSP